MAGATGLEPAASCVTGRCSNQLNYAPACDKRQSLLFVPSGSLNFPTVPSGSLKYPRLPTAQHGDVTYWILTVLTARSRSFKGLFGPAYWTLIATQIGTDWESSIFLCKNGVGLRSYSGSATVRSYRVMAGIEMPSTATVSRLYGQAATILLDLKKLAVSRISPLHSRLRRGRALTHHASADGRVRAGFSHLLR